MHFYNGVSKIFYVMGYPHGSVIKNYPPSAGDAGSISGSGRSPWRRKWQSTPVFLPGESHRQRTWQSAVHRVEKELDMT